MLATWNRECAMRAIWMTGILLGLAACGTPQEQCINGVTRDLHVVERLIGEVQGNLDRGYALVDVDQTTTEFVDCTPRPSKKDPDPKPRQCFEDVTRTVTRPAAINLDEEAATLASLQRKRKALTDAASPGIAACRAQYPE